MVGKEKLGKGGRPLGWKGNLFSKGVKKKWMLKLILGNLYLGGSYEKQEF
jgi:hypothetical protein